MCRVETAVTVVWFEANLLDEARAHPHYPICQAGDVVEARTPLPLDPSPTTPTATAGNTNSSTIPTEACSTRLPPVMSSRMAPTVRR